MAVGAIVQDKNANEAAGQLAGGLDEADVSPVNRMFEGRSVFITGASGFIGRVLLEKLLRSYGGIKRVYILLRPKRNMEPTERLHKQLLGAPIFDQIRSMKNGQELLEKIVIMAGDIGEERLGLSEADSNMMLNDESLSIVFHSAATVKFDEPLGTSIKFNLMATASLIELCKRLSNLIAVCHVSTAYVNSDIKNNEPIMETIYPMKHNPHQMISLAKLLDDELMQQIKPLLVEARPNTYTFTKALSEHLIALEASNLPVAIVRPSIVVAAWKEPIPGWVDNLNGPTGLILAVGKGLLRSMHVQRHCKADIIPVDIVVNTMIASSYYVAKTSGKLGPMPAQMLASSALEERAAGSKSSMSATTDEQLENQLQGNAARQTTTTTTKDESRVPPIFHCTSGEGNPVTWGHIENMFSIIRKYPSIQVLRYPFGTFKSNKYHDKITRWFAHLLPALIIDLICVVMGRKRQLLSIYLKLHSAINALTPFSTTNYNFESKNIRKLQESLTHPADREQLYMEIRSIEWRDFWETYVLGAR